MTFRRVNHNNAATFTTRDPTKQTLRTIWGQVWFVKMIMGSGVVVAAINKSCTLKPSGHRKKTSVVEIVTLGRAFKIVLRDEPSHFLPRKRSVLHLVVIGL